jgi:uncharacterized protein YndB with AHSA1/START domain
MSKFFRSVSIHAPVQKVFDYLTESAHLPEIWPSMIEVKDVPGVRGVGATFKWVYKMAGMRFEGVNETTEYVPNERVVSKNTGGIPSTFTWTYLPENGHTKLTMEVEYTVPTPLLGKLAEAFIVKMNEHEAETVLANLKDRMEV